MTSANKAAEILLVEDNEGDAMLTRECLADLGMNVQLHHVPHGEAGLAFLRRQGAFVDAPRPDLILVDLNMPVMDGREFVTQVVGDPTLRELPVVVLTTSRAANDVRRMYALRCNSYVVKPVDLGEFSEQLAGIMKYWFGLVALPPSGSQI